jgi:hypothetical protein
MTYHLRNTHTGQNRLCATLEEAHEKVNEIVSNQQEWVIIKLPEQDVGVGHAVSSGRGPIS